MTKLNKGSEEQINQSIDLLKAVLGEDLLGVYLHGSALVGGLQKYSDIDLLVVSQRPTTYAEKSELVKNMLQISGIYMQSSKFPMEVTIVVQSEVNPWRYPPKFDFQYGDWLRKEFASGNIEPWSTKEMPNLAVVVTKVFLASKTLVGPDPVKLLGKVPYKDFLTATTDVLDSLMKDLNWDKRNVILTFARIWKTLETDTITSKPAAAEWASARLPNEYQIVMQRAKAICNGEEEEHWEDIEALLQPCANFMLGQIRKQIALLKTQDLSNKTIKL